MRDKFVNTLFDIAKKDKNVVLLTGDLGYNVLNRFWEQLPEQFFNCGIAEQNMLGVAAGLALSGKKPYIYSIGNFPTLRAVEFIRNDICYHKANVKIVAIGGGFSYGTLGVTHHATEDIAMMRALPEMTVCTPADPTEVEMVVKQTYQISKPTYIRLGRGGETVLHNQTSTPFGKAIKMYDGKDIAIFACGSILEEAIKARHQLSQMNMEIAVYSFPTTKPMDKETVIDVASRFKHIYTLEEHTIVGGFGSAVCETVSEMSGDKAQITRIGLNDEFSVIVGYQNYLRDCYNMSADKISRQIINDYSQQTNSVN